MKKKVLGMLTVLFCVMMLPICAQAASIEAKPKSMNVNDIVEIKVKLDNKSEAIQFDVEYDNDRYDYVIGSATTSLSYTTSNQFVKSGKKVVRVVAIDYGGKKTNEITLKFKATATGSNVPFTVAGDKVIIDSSEEALPAGKSKANVNKIEPAKVTPPTKPGTVTPGPVVGGTTNNAGSPYINDAGQPITALPQTGGVNSVSGVYHNLIAGKSVVLYALPTSDTLLSAENVLEEFPTAVNATGTAITGTITTGSIISLSGEQHHIVIYGDVNKDGKVDVRDALIMIREEKANTLDDLQKLAGDLDGNSKVDRADALMVIDKFIVKNDSNENTNTAVKDYPVDITGATFTAVTELVKPYRFENIDIYTVKPKEGETLTEDVVTYTMTTPKNATGSKVTFTKDNDTIKAKLYPTVAGTYIITPVVSGAKVKDGEIKSANPITIDVEENYAVTSVGLKIGETVSNNVAVKMNTEAYYEIGYYHTYANGNQIEVPADKVSSVVFSTEGEPDCSYLSRAKLYSGDTAVTYDKLTGTIPSPVTNIDKIFFEAYKNHTQGYNATEGTETLSLTVTNSSQYGGESFEVPITVDVIDNIEKGGILLNGCEPSKFTLTLYDVEEDAEIPEGINVKEIDGTYYTMVSVTAMYNDEDKTPYTLYYKDITTGTGSANIVFTQNNGNLKDVEMKRFYSKDGQNFDEIKNQNGMVNYLGFALDEAEEVDGKLQVTYDVGSNRTTDDFLAIEVIPIEVASPLSLKPEDDEEEVVDEEEIDEVEQADEEKGADTDADKPKDVDPDSATPKDPEQAEESKDPKDPVDPEGEAAQKGEGEQKDPETTSPDATAPETPKAGDSETKGEGEGEQKGSEATTPETPVVPDPAPEDTTPTGPEVTEGQTPVTPEGAGVPTEPAE